MITTIDRKTRAHALASAGLWVLVAGWNGAVQGAGMDHSHHHHMQEESQTASAQSSAADPHAHHRAMMSNNGYQRTEHQYTLADIPVVDMDGSQTTLLEVLQGDKPIMVNFIFTTCTTICPVLSAVFHQVQTQLGPEAEQVRMVSISIDPEYDTPERLRTYAKLYKAGSQWQFLTGTLQDMVAVQKAFDVYRGSKMNHEPTIFLRNDASGPWVRLDGLASAADITKEYRQLVALH